tara:strand:+ start:46 stop:291 length:246 start_codon:yes stop_codon:yes gene_type:complete
MNEASEIFLIFIAFILILNFLGTLMFNSILGARVDESLRNNEENPHFDSKKYLAKARLWKWSLRIIVFIMIYWATKLILGY